MSAEERVAAVEKAYADEEAAQSAVLAELKRLRENAFKQTQEFNQLKGRRLGCLMIEVGMEPCFLAMFIGGLIYMAFDMLFLIFTSLKHLLRYPTAQELNKVAEMTGTNAAIRSMKSKIGKLDKETLKQQEIMYNQVGIMGCCLNEESS